MILSVIKDFPVTIIIVLLPKNKQSDSIESLRIYSTINSGRISKLDSSVAYQEHRINSETKGLRDWFLLSPGYFGGKSTRLGDKLYPRDRLRNILQKDQEFKPKGAITVGGPFKILRDYSTLKGLVSQPLLCLPNSMVRHNAAFWRFISQRR